MHRGQPLLSRVAVDFSTACKVLLGAVEIAQHRWVLGKRFFSKINIWSCFGVTGTLQSHSAAHFVYFSSHMSDYSCVPIFLKSVLNSI